MIVASRRMLWLMLMSMLCRSWATLMWPWAKHAITCLFSILDNYTGVRHTYKHGEHDLLMPFPSLNIWLTSSPLATACPRSSQYKVSRKTYGCLIKGGPTLLVDTVMTHKIRLPHQGRPNPLGWHRYDWYVFYESWWKHTHSDFLRRILLTKSSIKHGVGTFCGVETYVQPFD